MADEDRAPSAYKITVKKVFDFHNETFRPGVTYWVAPHVYADNLEDGRAFKDLCFTAKAEYPVAT